MEGKEGLNWLEVGMPETEQDFPREWSCAWCWDKKQSQLCLAAILEWECSGSQAQGHTLGCRAGWGVDPQAEMPHENTLGFGAVYIRNLFVMQLCRFHAELHIVMGLCPMHCSLTSFIFKHKDVFNSPRGYHKNSPTGATIEPCWSSCSWPPLSFASSSRGYSTSNQSRARVLYNSVPPPHPRGRCLLKFILGGILRQRARLPFRHQSSRFLMLYLPQALVPRTGWMGICKTWSSGRCSCLWQEFGMIWSLRSLPTQSLL